MFFKSLHFWFAFHCYCIYSTSSMSSSRGSENDVLSPGEHHVSQRSRKSNWRVEKKSQSMKVFFARERTLIKAIRRVSLLLTGAGAGLERFSRRRIEWSTPRLHIHRERQDTEPGMETQVPVGHYWARVGEHNQQFSNVLPESLVSTSHSSLSC